MPGEKMSDNELRKAVIQAANKCFSEKGVKKTTLKELAVIVGADRAKLKSLFGNKNLLVLAAQTYEIDRLKLAYMRKVPNASLEEMIKFIIRTRFDFLEKNSEQALIFFLKAIMGREPWSSKLDQVIWGLSVEFAAVIEKGVRQGVVRKSGDVQVAVRAITSLYLTAVVSVGVRASEMNSDDMWSFLEPQLDLVLKGLKA